MGLHEKQCINLTMVLTEHSNLIENRKNVNVIALHTSYNTRSVAYHNRACKNEAGDSWGQEVHIFSMITYMTLFCFWL